MDSTLILQKLRQKYGNVFRFFKKGYWKIHRTVFLCRNHKTRFSFLISFLFGYSQLIKDIQKFLDYKELCIEIQGDQYLAFSPLYYENRTQIDLNRINLALTWIEGLLNHSLEKEQVALVISDYHLTTELVTLQYELKDAKYLIRQGFDFLQNSFPNFTKLITASEQPLSQISLSKIREFLDGAEVELDIFRDWNRYQECLADLRKMGTEEFIASKPSSG